MNRRQFLLTGAALAAVNGIAHFQCQGRNIFREGAYRHSGRRCRGTGARFAAAAANATGGYHRH